MAIPNTATIRLHPRWPYLTLAQTAMQRTIAYRMTFFFNLVTGLIWVVVLYYLWLVVYASTATVGEYDWRAMRTYIVVSYAVNALLSYMSVSRILWAVRSGQIASEVLRPLDYLSTQLAQSAGSALIEGGLGGIVAVAMGIWLLDIAPPVSLLAALCFGVSVVLGYLIKFLVSYMTSLLCFWTTEGQGLIWGQIAIVNILSGALIPLDLLPGWLKSVVLVLPFQGILYTPVSIYLGQRAGVELMVALLVQVVWGFVLWRLARLLWRPAMRALEIQGG